MFQNMIKSFKKTFIVFLHARITGFIALAVLLFISLISHYLYK